jgi:hypothetical protein
MDDNEYSRVSPIPNILPGLPPMPVYDGATAVEQDAIKDAYKQAMDTFVEAHAFKNHLKALLIKAAPTLYINDFDDATMGHAQATLEQLLIHLVEW